MKFFTQFIKRVLFTSLLAFADDPENGTGGQPGGDNGGEPGEPGASDPENGKDPNEPNDPAPKTPDAKTRYQISQAKKEAAAKVLKWEPKEPAEPQNPAKVEFDLSSPEAQEALNKLVEDKLKGFDLEKLSKIDEFETQRVRDTFFSEVMKSGEQYKEYGLSLDREQAQNLIYDIEENWFEPEHIILLQNAPMILEKLKMLPKVPMSTDGWQKTPTDKKNVSMMDRIKSLREKHSN